MPLEINLELCYSGPTPFMECPKAKFTTMNTVLYGPLSCGWTHITSVDPFFEAPALDPVYYAHRLDFETHVIMMLMG